LFAGILAAHLLFPLTLGGGGKEIRNGLVALGGWGCAQGAASCSQATPPGEAEPVFIHGGSMETGT